MPVFRNFFNGNFFCQIEILQRFACFYHSAQLHYYIFVNGEAFWINLIKKSFFRIFFPLIRVKKQGNHKSKKHTPDGNNSGLNCRIVFINGLNYFNHDSRPPSVPIMPQEGAFYNRPEKGARHD
jgi:hypothetical protein